MYRLVRSATNRVPVDKSFKTAEIVQKSTTQASQIREPQTTYRIGTKALLALLHEDRPCGQEGLQP